MNPCAAIVSGSYRLRPSITMGYLSSALQAVEIEIGELLPLGEDQQGIGVVRRFVGGVGEFEFPFIASWARSIAAGS